MSGELSLSIFLFIHWQEKGETKVQTPKKPVIWVVLNLRAQWIDFHYNKKYKYLKKRPFSPLDILLKNQQDVFITLETGTFLQDPLVNDKQFSRTTLAWIGLLLHGTEPYKILDRSHADLKLDFVIAFKDRLKDPVFSFGDTSGFLRRILFTEYPGLFQSGFFFFDF